MTKPSHDPRRAGTGVRERAEANLEWGMAKIE